MQDWGTATAVLFLLCSGKEPHAINGLKFGEAYTLHEEVAAKGYVIANDFEFTLLDDFKIALYSSATPIWMLSGKSWSFQYNPI